jgi:hypothetical protein
MPMALLWLGFCRGVQGRFDEAETLLRASIEGGLLAAQMFLPEVLARAGRVEEARAIVRALDENAGRRYISMTTLALVHASIGEKDRSLALLAQAEQERPAMFALAVLGPGYLSLAPVWIRDWFAACRDRIGAARAASRITSTTSDQTRG